MLRQGKAEHSEFSSLRLPQGCEEGLRNRAVWKMFMVRDGTYDGARTSEKVNILKSSKWWQRKLMLKHELSLKEDFVNFLCC